MLELGRIDRAFGGSVDRAVGRGVCRGLVCG